MPSILFHELVGYKFAKKHIKYDNSSFYLGIIVPDAVNAYGFASKEDRWQSHYRNENLDIWKNNIIEFYKQNEKNYDKSYILGYLIHVLTDVICDEIYTKKLYPELLEKGYDYSTAYKYYEEGIKKLENNNIEKKWLQEVENSIKNEKGIKINNIDEKMINDWKNYNFKKYDDRKYEEAGYITEKFVDNVLDEIEETINKNKINID